MTKFLGVVIVVASIGTVALRRRAPADLSREVDRVVEAERKAQQIPGVSLAVCRDGKIVKASGYGLANVEWEVPVMGICSSGEFSGRSG